MDLLPCPSRPVCVSSQATRDDIDHFIRAINIGSTPADRVFNVLADLVTNHRRMRVTGRAGNMLQAVVKSRVLRLRSDLTFTVDEEAGLLHFRSASRLALFDFHSNRKRMEDLAPLIRERLRDSSEARVANQLSAPSNIPSSSEFGTTPSGATIRSTALRSLKTVEIENTAEPSPS